MANVSNSPQVRYQDGTLERMLRKKGPDSWTYRWVERGSGKRRHLGSAG